MIILIIVCLFFSSTLPCYANLEQNYYAKIMYDDVMLYSSPLDLEDSNNIMFYLPYSYFVLLKEEVNSTFYKVEYLSFSGYVKKQQVKPVAEVPKTPYLNNISFRIYAELSRDLRLYPNTKGGANEQVAYIPLMSTNLTYFGSVHGETLIQNRTDVWYYCKYSADKDYYGYVYSDFCDEMSQINDNTEKVTYIENLNLSQNTTQQDTALPLKNKTTGIIIALLSVPAMICAFLILKNSTIIKKGKIKSGEVVDY